MQATAGELVIKIPPDVLDNLSRSGSRQTHIVYSECGPWFHRYRANVIIWLNRLFILNSLLSYQHAVILYIVQCTLYKVV